MKITRMAAAIVGAPGSGRTTYANGIARLCEKMKLPYKKATLGDISNGKIWEHFYNRFSCGMAITTDCRYPFDVDFLREQLDNCVAIHVKGYKETKDPISWKEIHPDRIYNNLKYADGKSAEVMAAVDFADYLQQNDYDIKYESTH